MHRLAPGSRRRAIASVLAVAVLAAVGCGRRATLSDWAGEPGGAAPSWSPSPTAAPTVYNITLEGDPAASYDTEAGAVSPLTAEVGRRYPGIEGSPCLERAAHAHAGLPPGLEQHLPLAFTEFALHWAGCPDPTATLSVLLTNQPGLEPMVSELAAVIDGGRYTHVGVAASPAPPPYTTRWFVLLVERRFAMKRIATSADPGSPLALQFRLSGEYSRCTIALTDPRGAAGTVEAGTGGDWVVAGFSLSREIGRQWIELIGHGASGPRVLALFPVEVGRSPPRQWIGSPVADERWVDSTEKAEALAAGLVQQDRARFGLPALEWDPRLAEIARAHSAEMADRGYFAHVSPITGSVADRLAAAGYPASFVAENIALAPTLAEAQESLMRSPGHRAAVLSNETTHLGIGVATHDDPHRGRIHLVTQIYVRRADSFAAP